MQIATLFPEVPTYPAPKPVSTASLQGLQGRSFNNAKLVVRHAVDTPLADGGIDHSTFSQQSNWGPGEIVTVTPPAPPSTAAAVSLRLRKGQRDEKVIAVGDAPLRLYTAYSKKPSGIDETFIVLE